MDDASRAVLLSELQDQADGPQQCHEIHERASGQALCSALGAAILLFVGGWLVSLPSIIHMRSAQWLCWVPGALLLAAGLAMLAGAEAFSRRNGRLIMLLTADGVQFANAREATPWQCFDAFEIQQHHLRLSLVFSVMAGQRVQGLTPPCFKSLAAPDARPVAACMRLRLWLFNPMFDGRRLDIEELTELLYAYLQAAQARRTLGKLFPEVQRFSAVRHSTGQ
ncbi:hypothetical protein [Pseudomonas sp. CNPSo 3701]|uniref:hypothetical protein n=1 Tax=Pseudomonas sp. CNPSo 3701 TaxID=3027943 RepID=UPI0023640BDC|nr:hypothetical protein [Pseudomonas sp. CNPSo 3701]MDD1506637.1 hypothetical protein [Pseudomonas sp. CNPSo 3701]